MSTTQDAPVIPVAGRQIRRAILHATPVRRPFQHWWLRDVLPGWLRDAIRTLPFPPITDANVLGKRDAASGRVFASQRNCDEFAACAILAGAFQDDATVGLLEDLTGIQLGGGFLRIEYCRDTDGFWLAPHTDIGAKLLTFLIYLSDHTDAEKWGTDIMDKDGQVLARVPGTANHGLIFVPGADTWHGFTKRPIDGVRRSLIVNYVKPEWRSRDELAFPDQPVISGNDPVAAWCPESFMRNPIPPRGR